MNNKENKPQVKIAKTPCNSLIVNKYQLHVLSTKEVTKPAGIRNMPQGTAHTVHTQKSMLVYIQILLLLLLLLK
jgi:hypothetical protein